MKFTRVIEGYDRTHEFKIGDIVRVLFAVDRITKEDDAGRIQRTYQRWNWNGQLPMYAYYVGYKYLSLGQVVEEDVGDEYVIMQKFFKATSTIKVACIKTNERGKEYFAYFGDIEPIARRGLTPEYLNWKKYDEAFRISNPELWENLLQIQKEEAFAMKCSCCGRFKKGGYGAKCPNPYCEGW